MKKIVLTIAALAASAAIVFSFAGCAKEDVTEPATEDVAVTAEADSDVDVVDVEVESDTVA